MRDLLPQTCFPREAPPGAQVSDDVALWVMKAQENLPYAKVRTLRGGTITNKIVLCCVIGSLNLMTMIAITLRRQDCVSLNCVLGNGFRAWMCRAVTECRLANALPISHQELLMSN